MTNNLVLTLWVDDVEVVLPNGEQESIQLPWPAKVKIASSVIEVMHFLRIHDEDMDEQQLRDDEKTIFDFLKKEGLA